jgi:hypothetical protein
MKVRLHRGCSKKPPAVANAGMAVFYRSRFSLEPTDLTRSREDSSSKKSTVTNSAAGSFRMVWLFRTFERLPGRNFTSARRHGVVRSALPRQRFRHRLSLPYRYPRGCQTEKFDYESNVYSLTCLDRMILRKSKRLGFGLSKNSSKPQRRGIYEMGGE